MPEEVLFESERRQTRSEVATYLRTVADKLDGGEEITLSAGGDSVTLAVPERPTFEVKAEREGEELSIELELEWGEDGDSSGGDLSIE